MASLSATRRWLLKAQVLILKACRVGWYELENFHQHPFSNSQAHSILQNSKADYVSVSPNERRSTFDSPYPVVFN